MKYFTPITAATVLFALVGAGSASALEKNAAELNFGSTHPGTVTGTTTLADRQTPVPRLEGDALGPIKSSAPARERTNALDLRNGADRGLHDLPAGFSIERHIPAD